MSDQKNIGVFAIVMAIVAQVVHTVESILTMGYYVDPAYFSVWSKVMMPTAGPPPTNFFIVSMVFAFLSWFLFGFVYEKLNTAIKVKDPVNKGVAFGVLAFLLAGLPSTLTMYLLINLPVGLLASWAISGFILYLLGGIVAAKMIK